MRQVRLLLVVMAWGCAPGDSQRTTGAKFEMAAARQSIVAPMLQVEPTFALSCTGRDVAVSDLMGRTSKRFAGTFVIDGARRAMFLVKRGALVQYPCRDDDCEWHSDGDRITLGHHDRGDRNLNETVVLDRVAGTMTLRRAESSLETGLRTKSVSSYACQRTRLPLAAQQLTAAWDF